MIAQRENLAVRVASSRIYSSIPPLNSDPLPLFGAVFVTVNDEVSFLEHTTTGYMWH